MDSDSDMELQIQNYLSGENPSKRIIGRPHILFEEDKAHLKTLVSMRSTLFLRELADELYLMIEDEAIERNIPSPPTVYRLLRDMDYTLKVYTLKV